MTEQIIQQKGNEDLLYPAEDAQQILQIAIAQQTETGELSRQQLLEIAEELGISAQTLLAAEQEWQIRKSELKDQKLFDQHRRQRLQHRLVRYGIVSVFFLGLRLILGGWFTPVLYVVLGSWALTLAWDAWRIYTDNEFSYRQEFERWRRQKQVKRAVNRFFNWLAGA